jgi:hypothetical protein
MTSRLHRKPIAFGMAGLDTLGELVLAAGDLSSGIAHQSGGIKVIRENGIVLLSNGHLQHTPILLELMLYLKASKQMCCLLRKPVMPS